MNFQAFSLQILPLFPSNVPQSRFDRFLSGVAQLVAKNWLSCGSQRTNLRFTAKELGAVLTIQQSTASVVSNVFFVTFTIVCALQWTLTQLNGPHEAPILFINITLACQLNYDHRMPIQLEFKQFWRRRWR